MFDPPITTIGKLIDSPQPKIYNVALPNGKMAIGHVAKALIHLHDSLKAGDHVHLELTPFDLTKARITGVTENIQ